MATTPLPGTPVWVADVSSILWPKRHVEKAQHVEIYKRLTILVETGEIVYVPQVVPELLAYAGKPDVPCDWAKENEAKACKRKVPHSVVKEVLDVAPVLDPHKSTGPEEADPYVLALAILLRRENVDARVLTEEQNDLPDKMSMASGCGLLGIPRMRIEPLLAQKNIWSKASGLL
jgi:hypothetical protein